MTPYISPPLSPERARLFNALTARDLPWEFEVEGRPCALDAGPDAWGEAVPFQAACAAHIRVGDGVWRVEAGSLELLLLHPEVAGAGGEALLSELPGELILALLEYLFGPLLERAAAWLRTSVTFAEAAAEPSAASGEATAAGSGGSGWVGLTLTLRPEEDAGSAGPERPGRTVPLRLYYPDAQSARYLAARLGDLPRRRGPAADLPVLCGLEAGYVRLTVAEARGLAPGDVLLPEAWTPEAPRLRLPGGPVFVCRAVAADAGRMEILGPVVPVNPVPLQEEPMPTENPPDAALSPDSEPSVAPFAVDADSLELTVRFELDRLTLTVGEVASLAAGFTFALHGDPASPVTLRVGDKAVAEGRLVDLNGIPGVQLTRILAPRGAVPSVPDGTTGGGMPADGDESPQAEQP